MGDNIHSNIGKERILSVKGITATNNDLITLSEKYPNVIFYANTQDGAENINNNPDIYLDGQRYTKFHGINSSKNSITVGTQTILLLFDEITGLMSLELQSAIKNLWLSGIDITNTCNLDENPSSIKSYIFGNNNDKIIKFGDDNKIVLYNADYENILSINNLVSETIMLETPKTKGSSSLICDKVTLIFCFTSKTTDLSAISFKMKSATSSYLDLSQNSTSIKLINKDTDSNSLYQTLLNTISDHETLIDEDDNLFLCTLKLDINRVYNGTETNGNAPVILEFSLSNTNKISKYSQILIDSTSGNNIITSIDGEDNADGYMAFQNIILQPTIKTISLTKPQLFVNNVQNNYNDNNITIPTTSNTSIKIGLTMNIKQNNKYSSNISDIDSLSLFKGNFMPLNEDADVTLSNMFSDIDEKNKFVFALNIIYYSDNGIPNYSESNINKLNNLFIKYVPVYNQSNVPEQKPNYYLTFSENEKNKVYLCIDNINNFISSIAHNEANNTDYRIYGFTLSLYSTNESGILNDNALSQSLFHYGEKLYLPKMPLIHCQNNNRSVNFGSDIISNQTYYISPTNNYVDPYYSIISVNNTNYTINNTEVCCNKLGQYIINNNTRIGPIATSHLFRLEDSIRFFIGWISASISTSDAIIQHINQNVSYITNKDNKTELLSYINSTISESLILNGTLTQNFVIYTKTELIDELNATLEINGTTVTLINDSDSTDILYLTLSSEDIIDKIYQHDGYSYMIIKDIAKNQQDNIKVSLF